MSSRIQLTLNISNTRYLEQIPKPFRIHIPENQLVILNEYLVFSSQILGPLSEFQLGEMDKPRIIKKSQTMSLLDITRENELFLQ